MHARSTLLLLLVAAGCDRAATATPPRASPAVAHLLTHLPDDTVAVASLALTELARAPLWRRAIGVVTYEAPDVATAVVSACSLDPWTIADAAAIAITASDDTDVIAATVKPDRAALEQCLSRAAALGGEAVTPAQQGALTAYEQAEGVEYVAWHDDHTLLARPLLLDDPDALDDALTERAPSPAITALLARVDRAATAWVVAVPGETGTLAEMLAAVPLARGPVGLHASLRREPRWVLAVGVQLATAAEVPAAIEVVRRGLAAFAGLAPWRDDIKVEAHGDEVRLRLELDATRATALEDAIIALLPAPSARPPAP